MALRRKLHLLVKKLSTQFNVKDRTKFEHKHDVIYLINVQKRTVLIITL